MRVCTVKYIMVARRLPLKAVTRRWPWPAEACLSYTGARTSRYKTAINNRGPAVGASRACMQTHMLLLRLDWHLLYADLCAHTGTHLPSQLHTRTPTLMSTLRAEATICKCRHAWDDTQPSDALPWGECVHQRHPSVMCTPL